MELWTKTCLVLLCFTLHGYNRVSPFIFPSEGVTHTPLPLPNPDWITTILLPPVGKISPSGDLYLTSQRSFELNCTLTAYEGSSNASNMLFEVYGSTDLPNTLPEDWQVPMSADSIQLKVPEENVTSGASGDYHCRIDNKSIATSSIIIGDPPKPVTNLTCVSSNLEYMNCTFCPEVVEFTVYTFLWDIDPGGTQLYKCPLQKEKNCFRCHWPPPQQWALMMHYVEISGSNIWGKLLNKNFTSSFLIDPAKNVRADPVKNLKASAVSSSSIVVTWDLPMSRNFVEFIELEFYVTYTNDKNGKTFKTVVQWNNTVMLKNLDAFTSYTISVVSKPNVGGYWSAASQTTGTTYEDAPSSGPTLAPGAFTISETTTNEENVFVYWESVPESNRNGKIIGYNINYIGTKHGENVTDEVAGDVAFYEFRREFIESYEVFIRAFTSAGISPPAMLLVPTISGPRPRNIDAEYITRDDIMFKWNSPEGVDSLDSYTFFVCKGNEETSHHCQAPTSHVTLPANSTSYTLSTPNVENVYALAANYKDAPSSGLGQEWICIYQFSGKPGVPRITAYGIDETTLRVSWSPVLCKDEPNPVRIITYKIVVSNSNNSTDTDGFPLEKEVPATDEWLDVPGVVPGQKYRVQAWAVSKDQSSGMAETIGETAKEPLAVWAIVLIILPLLIAGIAVFLILYRVKRKCCRTVQIIPPEKPEENLLEDTHLLEPTSANSDVDYLGKLEEKPESTKTPDTVVEDNGSNSSGYASEPATPAVGLETPFQSSRQLSRTSATSSNDQIEPYPRVGPKSTPEPGDFCGASVQYGTHSYPEAGTIGEKSTTGSYLDCGSTKVSPNFDQVPDGPPVEPSYDENSSESDNDQIFEGEKEEQANNSDCSEVDSGENQLPKVREPDPLQVLCHQTPENEPFIQPERQEPVLLDYGGETIDLGQCSIENIPDNILPGLNPVSNQASQLGQEPDRFPYVPENDSRQDHLDSADSDTCNNEEVGYA